MPSKPSHSDYAGYNKSATPLFAFSIHSLSYNRPFRVIEGSESEEVRVYTKFVV